MGAETIKDARQRMDKAIEVLQHEFATLRTGRATPGLLEGIKLDYYGTSTPLNQMASISVPEPKTLLIQPWDMTQIGAMEKAIMTSGLGLNPQNDGKVIRLILPPPTEERRKELVKVARKFAEDAKVAVRNIRRDANEAMKKLEKDKELTEDQLKKSQDEIQKLTDNEIRRVDDLLSKKEKEILEV